MSRQKTGAKRNLMAKDNGGPTKKRAVAKKKNTESDDQGEESALQSQINNLKKELGEIKTVQHSMQSMMATQESDGIKKLNYVDKNIQYLNVGGTTYMTDLQILQKGKGTRFRLYSDRDHLPKHATDKYGNLWIDRDGQLFRYILNFLRTSTIHLPDGIEEKKALLVEAEHFECAELKEALKKAIGKD